MLERIIFKGKSYPKFQSEGNSAKFIIPFAKEICKGTGVDVGCNREEWCLPGAYPIDPVMTAWDAYNFPKNGGLDYIFSSHCLEHLPDWVKALDYWHTRLKSGGIVFLYLPDHSQVYWRPWHNRKHVHCLTPEIVGNYFIDQPELWSDVMVSNVDLNNAFTIIAEKK